MGSGGEEVRHIRALCRLVGEFFPEEGAEGLPETEAVADGQQQEKKQEGATDALNRPTNVKPCERVERVVGVFYRPAL